MPLLEPCPSPALGTSSRAGRTPAASSWVEMPATALAAGRGCPGPLSRRPRGWPHGAHPASVQLIMASGAGRPSRERASQTFKGQPTLPPSRGSESFSAPWSPPNLPRGPGCHLPEQVHRVPPASRGPGARPPASKAHLVPRLQGPEARTQASPVSACSRARVAQTRAHATYVCVSVCGSECALPFAHLCICVCTYHPRPHDRGWSWRKHRSCRRAPWGPAPISCHLVGMHPGSGQGLWCPSHCLHPSQTARTPSGGPCACSPSKDSGLGSHRPWHLLATAAHSPIAHERKQTASQGLSSGPLLQGPATQASPPQRQGPCTVGLCAQACPHPVPLPLVWEPGEAGASSALLRVGACQGLLVSP